MKAILIWNIILLSITFASENECVKGTESFPSLFSKIDYVNAFRSYRTIY